MKKLEELSNSELLEVNGGGVFSGLKSLFNGLSSMFSSMANKDKEGFGSSINNIVDSGMEMLNGVIKGDWE